MYFFIGGALQVGSADLAKVRMFKCIDIGKLELVKYDGFNKLHPRYEV